MIEVGQTQSHRGHNNSQEAKEHTPNRVRHDSILERHKTYHWSDDDGGKFEMDVAQLIGAREGTVIGDCTWACGRFIKVLFDNGDEEVFADERIGELQWV